METRIRNNNSERVPYREIFDAEEQTGRLKVYIKSKLKVYSVVPVGTMVIDKEEFCAGECRFTVIKDEIISFNQGDAVSVKFDNESIFYGYVFKKSRDKEGLIRVACYDQLRYLKNRRSYTRGRMRIDEVVSKIALDYSLTVGDIDRGKVLLPPVAADNVSLLDVIIKGCKDTRRLSGERFILYDDFGRLTLKNEDSLAVGIMIDATQAADFVYTDTIDKDVYNMIEIYSDTKKLNLRAITTVKDTDTMGAWGTLILSKKATDPESAYAEGRNLLEEYNRVNREIVLKRVKGDIRFIPGCSVYVKMVMGDLTFDGYVRVRRVIHTMENNCYWTDLYLDGSELE